MKNILKTCNNNSHKRMRKLYKMKGVWSLAFRKCRNIAKKIFLEGKIIDLFYLVVTETHRGTNLTPGARPQATGAVLVA